MSAPILPPAFTHTHAAEVRDYPQWHRGRERYGLWMLPIGCPQLLAYIHALKQQLADLLHPTQRQPHITLFVCGFEQPANLLDDDFTPAQLAQQCAALQALNVPACTLEIGRPSSFATAAYLPVGDPEGGLQHWRTVLEQAGNEVRQAVYIPHITLGLYRRTLSYATLQARLQALPAPPVTNLRADCLEYVSYRQDEQFSRLDCHHRIIFGGT